MLDQLFKKYDESRKDMLVNGWNNLEKFKAEINKLLEKCFDIYGFEETKLYSYQLKSLQLKEYKLPAFFGKYISIKAMNGLVYLLNENGVDIYRIR